MTLTSNKSIKIRYFLPVILIFLFSCVNHRKEKGSGNIASPSDTVSAEISFTRYEYDFGKISEGEKVAHIFSFENRGTGDLVISSVSTSCGCTVTKYDRNPIASGKGGTIEVVFDSSGRNGSQTKTVSVHSNSRTRVVILKITAEVVPVKSG